MIEQIRKLMQDIHSLPKDQWSRVTAVAIFWALAYMTYYIMLGITVIVLGRRIIYATLAAWKETRREPS